MAHSWPRTMGVLTRAWVHHDGSFRAEMPVPALDSLSRGAAVRGPFGPNPLVRSGVRLVRVAA